MKHCIQLDTYIHTIWENGILCHECDYIEKIKCMLQSKFITKSDAPKMIPMNELCAKKKPDYTPDKTQLIDINVHRTNHSEFTSRHFRSVCDKVTFSTNMHIHNQFKLRSCIWNDKWWMIYNQHACAKGHVKPIIFQQNTLFKGKNNTEIDARKRN